MMEFGGLGDDFFEERKSEKDYRKKVKTQEELDKLTVDENLNEIDKAIYILKSGQQLQYVSVVRNLPALLQSWPDKCYQTIVPKIKDLLSRNDENLHTAASETFSLVANDPNIPHTAFSSHLIKIVVIHLKNHDLTLARIWSTSFAEMLTRVPDDVIRDLVLPVALVMGQLSNPTSSRLQSCKIIGAICRKFAAASIKKELLPKIKLLCQDVDQDVRACMCSHLHTVAKALGPVDTRHLILEEIYELTTDEEHQVVEQAWDAFLAITPLLDKENLLMMKPLLMDYCTQALYIEETQTTLDSSMLDVSDKYGKLCASVVELLSSDEKKTLVDIYHRTCLLGRYKLQKRNDKNVALAAQERLAEICKINESFTRVIPSPTPVTRLRDFKPSAPTLQNIKKDDLLECRRFSAFNLPAMFDIFRENKYTAKLMECSVILASDDDVIVRKRVASGLHEIARILGPQACSLKLHLDSILRQNDSHQIVQGCLDNLGETLIKVSQYDQECKGAGLSDIVTSLQCVLTKFEDKWGLMWRSLEKLILQLRVLHEIITSEQIYAKFLPCFFKMLIKNPYLPVRQAVAKTICYLLRYNKKTEQRREILDVIVQDLCRSKSYRDRLLFLDFCEYIINIFSRRFFKQNIFVHVMSLFDDKVANVRLCLCRLLPSMKRLLVLPNDRILHSQLEEGVRKFLSSENDKDVSRAIRATIFELDRTVLKRPSLGSMTPADNEDERKEREENMLASREDKSHDLPGKGPSSLSAMAFRGGQTQKAAKYKKRNSSATSFVADSSSWSSLPNSPSGSSPSLKKSTVQTNRSVDSNKKPQTNSKKPQSSTNDDYSFSSNQPRASTTDRAGSRTGPTPGPSNRGPVLKPSETESNSGRNKANTKTTRKK